MNEETVTISKRVYDSLLDSEAMLTALEDGGVDNWQWYGESLRDYWAERAD